MERFKKLLSSSKKEVFLAALSLCLISAALMVFSVDVDTVSAQAGGQTRTDDRMENLPTQFDFRTLAVLMVNWILAFVGLVAVAMFIVGGFMYITSQGEQGGMDKGKKTMTYAMIGIAVIMLSFAIVNTTLNTWETGETDNEGT